MKQKTIEFSIDKLTILGQFKHIHCYDTIKLYLTDIPFSHEVYIDNQFFNYSSKIGQHIFFQMDKMNNNMRIEFNPNLITDNDNIVLKYILTNCKDFHFTRLDLALDLFNYDLYNYNILDIKTRKKAYYYDNLGKLETIYFGSLKSNKFIRIYNKAKEQKLDDVRVDWWRIELQLRDTYIDRYLNNYTDLFDGLLIFKYVNLEHLEFTTRANLEYILGDMSRLYDLSKPARLKYKKIINNLKTESITFITDIIYHSKQDVVTYLDELLV